MKFQAPEFIEIKMDAEIGSYQQDDQRPLDEPAFIAEQAE
jgi:hypothetical protein